MAVTKGQLISDIENRLTRGKPSDDLELSRSQIGFWLDSERDFLVSQYLDKKIKSKEPIDPYYITGIDKCLSLSTEEDECDTEDCQYRYYITLTQDVLSLVGDRGVMRINDQNGNILIYSNKDDMDVFQYLSFAKPSRKRQFSYREGLRIYIEKIKPEMVKYLTYDVFYVPAYSGFEIEEDEDYIISSHLIPELLTRVEEIAWRQMLGQFEDLHSDGKQA